jgi:fructose-bisphosphate aldolase class I
MTSRDPESVALALVAQGKRILAADETIPTLTRRSTVLGIQSTEESRRTYREMLFTSPGVSEFISGALMYDETIRQKRFGGGSLVKALAAQASFRGRALQDPALEAWHGREDHLAAGQRAPLPPRPFQRSGLCWEIHG